MLRIFASLFLALLCAQALADPPVRVARLAYVRGPVSFSPAGTNDWAVAGLNRPLVAGDRVWTDNGGRDELQLGGVALRMDSATLLSILTLDDRALQVQLSQGSLNVRVRPGPAAGLVEVDTPNLALTIDQPGHYRVSVDPAGNTTAVRVDDGQAQATGQYQAYAINPGQDVLFNGPDLRNAQALDPRYRDAFDRWCLDRDRRADRALAARYVSPATIGYEDLDDYGSWRSVPEYGNVWIPRDVPRGWAPYRDGHWAWIEPYGWTWIDDAPWGFSTTHYGRWANMNGSWGWVPEPANALPVYAPALVAFAAGALFLEHEHDRHHREPDVAWFPLAPHEAYRPAYQASPRYLGALNFNAHDAATGNYRNRMVNGAMTAVPASVFTRAQPVRRAAVAVPAARAAQAPVVVAPQVQAGPQSFASHSAGGHRPAPALLARPAMTRMRPAIAGAPHTPAAVAPAPQPVPNVERPQMAHGHALPPGAHGFGAAPMPAPAGPVRPAEGRDARFAPALQPQPGRAFAGAPAAAVPETRHGQEYGRQVPPQSMPDRGPREPAAMPGPQHGPQAVPHPPPGLARAAQEVARPHAMPPQQEPQPRPAAAPPVAHGQPHAPDFVPRAQPRPANAEPAGYPQPAPQMRTPRSEPGAHFVPAQHAPQAEVHAPPPRPEPAAPPRQAPAPRAEPHPAPAPRAEPHPAAAPRAEPPRPPAPHPEPVHPQPPAPHPQPAARPAEPRPAPPAHPAPPPPAQQAARDAHPQHGHGDHKDDHH